MVMGNNHQREAGPRAGPPNYSGRSYPARQPQNSPGNCSKTFAPYPVTLTRPARASPAAPFGPPKDPTSRRANSLFSLYLQQMDQFYRYHIRIISLQDGRRRAAPAIGMTG